MRRYFDLRAACAMCATLIQMTLPAAGKVYSIPDYGAKADGSLCTRAFADAMDAAAAAGGGRVFVPKGRWFTGPIHFRSNCELHLDDGAEVVFSQNPSDYLPAVPTTWEGIECWNYSPLVYAYCCTNVAISGSGVLRAFDGDFKSSFWATWQPSSSGAKELRNKLYDWGSADFPVEKRRMTEVGRRCLRPQFIQFNRCRNVRLEGFKVRESPFWTIHLFLCDGVVARDLDVVARGSNNDGIDLEMTRNVLIERCSFDQGDDTFVFKSGRNRDGWRLGVPTENVEIRDCHMKRAKSFFTVGSEISGGVRNIWMHDCSVGEATVLAQIKTNKRRGGFVEGVRMTGVRGGKADRLFCIATDVYYEWREFPDHELKTTRIADVELQDVFCGEVRSRVDVQGDADSPICGVKLKNVRAGSSRVPDRFGNAIGVVEDDRPVSAWPDYLITDFGTKQRGAAAGDAIVRAIDAASRSGGGRVVVPVGTWKSGPIELKENVEFHMASGAKIVFSDDPAEYRRPDGSYRPLFSAENLNHARISGNFGRLEALVEGWCDVPLRQRPPLARFTRCSRLCIEAVAFRNAPGRVMEFEDCTDALVRITEFIANVSDRDFIGVISGAIPDVSTCFFRRGDGRLEFQDPILQVVHPVVDILDTYQQ